jgi:hypothetical protein
MLPKFTLPVLAIIGFSFGVFTVVNSNQPTPIAQPVAQPADSPTPTLLQDRELLRQKVVIFPSARR